jgi:HAD superfamily hydrolase (TIGR01509 family)
MAVEEHMTMRGIKAVLFDLGGVLIQLGGITKMMGWAGLDREEFWRRWLASPSVRRFESGKITAEEFGFVLVEEFNLPVQADEFLALFATWPQGVYPGAEELLRNTGALYPLGCLTNTNSLHWKYLIECTNLLGYFDYLFPSHHTGLLKPDRSSFTNAADKMGFQPEQILFLDDNQVNIEGATGAGLTSYLVQNANHARIVLEELGVQG